MPGDIYLLHGFLQLLEEGELLLDVGFLFVLLEVVLQVLEGGLLFFYCQYGQMQYQIDSPMVPGRMALLLCA